VHSYEVSGLNARTWMRGGREKRRKDTRQAATCTAGVPCLERKSSLPGSPLALLLHSEARLL